MSNRDVIFIFLTGLVIFIIGLSPEFVGFDCRFAMFAQEMLRNGPTFFPTTYGRPYPDYPAASTFMIYLASLPFGTVTHFSAVLPTAVVSALILVVIYRIGAIHSRQWGLFAVMVMLFTHEFLSRSRSLTPDQYICLITTLSFYLAYSANVYGRKKRLWFIPLLLTAGFAFRGPIGIVIPAAVVCTYYLFNRDFRLFILSSFVSLILFVICFKALLIAAAYQGGTDLVNHVWKMEMAGRMDEARQWIGYYWTESFTKYAIAYPFAVIVAVSLSKKLLRRENADYKFLGSLIIWMLVILLGMSIPGTKKIRYIVSMAPAAALVASYLFICPPQKGVLSGVKEMFLNFCRWFPAVTGVVVLVIWIFGSKIHAFSMLVAGQKIPALPAGYYLAAIFLMALLTAAAWYVTTYQESWMRDLISTAVGTATFIVIIVCIEDPMSYACNRTKPFVEKVETLQKQNPCDLVFYKISADRDAIKFMVNLDKPILPGFIKAPEAILSYTAPAYFISHQEDFTYMPENVAQHVKVLAEGKIGDENFVIFALSEMLRSTLEHPKYIIGESL